MRLRARTNFVDLTTVAVANSTKFGSTQVPHRHSELSVLRGASTRLVDPDGAAGRVLSSA